MLNLVILMSLVGVALSDHSPVSEELDNEWIAFIQTYNRQYEEGGELLRRMIWEKNVRHIQSHNLAADRGQHTYWLGVNKYTDTTHEEFVASMNGFNATLTTSQGACSKYSPPRHVTGSLLPDTVDWRKEGYVTDVKDQGTCGSCWAFSATGSLEGQHYQTTKKLVSLSEKNLMDCSRREGNKGCKGGTMDQAFDYVIINHGIDSEKSYPYVPKDGMCKFERQFVQGFATGCMDLKTGNEAELKMAVATVGPISVAMDAGHVSFQHYRHGVYSEVKCSSKQLDHGVLVVGYGIEDKDYWLVKNSWGTSWGMEGYVMIARNEENMCGLASMASFPIV